MELINMDVRQIIELSKKEINNILNIETLVFEEDERDDDFFEFKSTINRKSLNEIVKVAKDKKWNDTFSDVKMFSRVFKFNVKKILGYNEIYYKVDKNAHFNNKYYEYREEIKKQITSDLIPFLNHKNVCLNISFFVNYTKKDLDNIENVMEQILKANYKKAFIDNLYCDQTGDDNMIKKINSEIFSTDGDEFILIKFETLTDQEIDQSLLLKEYNKQYN